MVLVSNLRLFVPNKQILPENIQALKEIYIKNFGP